MGSTNRQNPKVETSRRHARFVRPWPDHWFECYLVRLDPTTAPNHLADHFHLARQIGGKLLGRGRFEMVRVVCGASCRCIFCLNDLPPSLEHVFADAISISYRSPPSIRV